ncbi:serine hydrolase domain-containing protein [Solemya velum gill symbiont]|uniref:serine hydrolase domain-containing protein n=1 Tax=Solemya velum gill symbiont TaxID=2340 RepID=UPI0009963508|nr:serine hydrolase domain-containing protein [Solemya velum gill symbiont]OOY45791.1 hypothetical protein BOV93_12250 [Solemya velum gill symbiont]
MSSDETTRFYLDRLVQDAKVPGIQYLAVGPNQTVFNYAGGWADIKGRRPLHSSTTLSAYSVSKTITAVAVLQLAETQNVMLDKPIDDYLEFQPYGPDVTVRQLLSHSSGIPNPIPLRWVHKVATHDAFDERSELTRILLKHPKLSSFPGTKYIYSNIGYWLLGQIVEHVSGKLFSSYVTDHIFHPLGILPQELGYKITDDGNHAKGYLEMYSLMNFTKRFLIDTELIGAYEGKWLHIKNHYANGPAFGGLIGNATGLGKFLKDQLRPHSVLFNDSTRQLFYASQCNKRGASIPMTLGWHIGMVGSTRFFYKEGLGGGFHAMMRIYPGSEIATIVMTNATSFDVGKFLDMVDPKYL